MAKVDLKKSLGYSVIYEEDKLYPADLEFTSVKEYTIQMMVDQLLNDELTYPEIVYKKYLGLDTDGMFGSKDIKINEFVIPANLMGIEYVKTKALLCPTFPKILEIHYGGGMLIMQKVQENEVSDVIVSKIRRDQKIIIPAGYAYSLINTRQQPPLIVSELYNKAAKNYSALDAVGGMSYYVIRKNAKQEIVKNPNYRTVPEKRSVKWDEKVTEYGLTLKTPVAKQIVRKYGKFDWLFKEDSVTI